jgi:hypothetical protein
MKFNALSKKIRILFAKIRHRITRRTYKGMPAPKFKIGDKVVMAGPSQDIWNRYQNGTIEDILTFGQEWCYIVVFVVDTGRIVLEFSDSEIELDKSYLREKRLKEIGIY